MVPLNQRMEYPVSSFAILILFFASRSFDRSRRGARWKQTKPNDICYYPSWKLMRQALELIAAVNGKWVLHVVCEKKIIKDI